MPLSGRKYTFSGHVESGGSPHFVTLEPCSWFREFVRGKLEITLSRVFFSVRKKPGTKKETVKGNSNDF